MKIFSGRRLELCSLCLALLVVTGCDRGATPACADDSKIEDGDANGVATKEDANRGDNGNNDGAETENPPSEPSSGAAADSGLIETCGLGCPDPDSGLLAGNASISGLQDVDSFFASVLELRDQSRRIRYVTEEILLGMLLELGRTPPRGLSIEQLADEVASRLSSHLSDQGFAFFDFDYRPARCRNSVDLARQLAASCSTKADIDDIGVFCEGACEISSESQAHCTGDFSLSCVRAVSFSECLGTCSGECQFGSWGRCGGICNGTCDGECDSYDGEGNCKGHCVGQCDGLCSVSIPAGAECSGKCSGECHWAPFKAECDEGSRRICEKGFADVGVECVGPCEGSVHIEGLEPVCEKATLAKLASRVECEDGAVDMQARFDSRAEAQEKLAFQAWSRSLEKRFLHLARVARQAGELSIGIETLVDAAGGSVKGEIDGLSGDEDLSLKDKVGIQCAVLELETVGEVLAEDASALPETIVAFTKVSGAIYQAK